METNSGVGEGSAKSVAYGDYKGVKWGWKKNFELGKIQALKFKNCAFKYKDDKGKSFVGVAILDFMPSKYKEQHKVKKFDFTKYQAGIINEGVSKSKNGKTRFNPKEIDFDNFDGGEDLEPIQNNMTDASVFFNSEDAIVYDIKKNKDSN